MTDNQKNLLLFVSEYRQKNGTGPSFREIQKNIGVSSVRSVHVIVKSLTKKGFLKNDHSQFRSLLLTSKGRKFLHLDSGKFEYVKDIPSYQQIRPQVYKTDSAAVLSTSSDLTFNGQHTVKTNGTTIQKGETDTINTGRQLNENMEGNGTKTQCTPILNIQNSTLNMPLSSLKLSEVKNFVDKHEYITPPVISFILISIFKGGFLWFFIILVSVFVSQKFDKYIKE